MPIDLAFLNHLDARSNMVLAHALSAQRPKSQLQARAQIQAALANPQMLRNWLETLPPAGREVMELLVECRGIVGVQDVERACTAVLGETQARQGLGIAQGFGVLLEDEYRQTAMCVSPLMQALRPMWDAWWRREHGRAPAAAERAALEAWAFDVKRLIACVRAEPLRLNRDGHINARASAALGKLFAGRRSDRWLEHTVIALRRCGVLSPLENNGVLKVRDDALVEAQRLDAAAWYMLVHRELLSGPLGAVLRYFWRRPGKHDVNAVLSRLALTSSSREPERATGWGGTARYFIELACQHGLLDGSPDGIGLAPTALAALHISTVRESLAALQSPVETEVPACHVQANFEIIVPPEIDIASLVQLASFCEVVRCDAVATLRITQRTVQRALAAGRNTAWMTTVLQRCARHGLPDNVARGLQDFAAECRYVYLFTDVIVAGEHAAALERISEFWQATRAPGVFRLSVTHGRATKKLEGMGFCVLNECDESDATQIDSRPPVLQQARGVLDVIAAALEEIEAYAALPPPAAFVKARYEALVQCVYGEPLAGSVL